jgi:hypothetical protein
MWMSSIIIVIDSKNVDRNNIQDLVAAVTDAGGVISEVDEPNYVVEATVPSYVIPTIAAMEGVVYVRSIFSYFSDTDNSNSQATDNSSKPATTSKPATKQAGDQTKSPGSAKSSASGSAAGAANLRPAPRTAVG